MRSVDASPSHTAISNTRADSRRWRGGMAAIDYYFTALRVTHFIAGITWIGLLYWFNFVNIPTFKELDAPTKNILIPRLVKRTLLWFRWSAVVTVVAGWLYFFSWWGGNNYFTLGTGISPPAGTRGGA